MAGRNGHSVTQVRHHSITNYCVVLIIILLFYRKSGLTYFNPQTCGWSRRFIPIEAAAMDASRVLLFVVSKETRSLSSMALAAHYIGLGCNVVLCVQFLPDNAEVNGDRVRAATSPPPIHHLIFIHSFFLFASFVSVDVVRSWPTAVKFRHQGLQSRPQLPLRSGQS